MEFFRIFFKSEKPRRSSELHYEGQQQIETTLRIDKRWLSEGDVERVKFIARGGFGSVFEVFHRGSYYAGKLFTELENPESFGYDEATILRKVEEIENECYFLSELCHPNIVQFRGVVQRKWNDIYIPLWMLMDLEDKPLSALIDSGVDPIECSRQIIEGLKFMHARNFVHRDLKPANILVSFDGVLKISDLGLTKYIDHTNIHSHSGTPFYMAPEVAHRRYSASADIFSYGVILCEMLIKQSPNEDSLRKEYRAQAIATAPEFANLIKGCLTIDPHRRWTIDRILAELDSIEASQNIYLSNN